MSRKEVIQSICAGLFRKYGYQNCSMADIATAIGIRPSSLYNHIASKQDILHQLLQQGAGLFEKGMADITSSALNPVEKVKRLIGLHVQLTINHTDLMAIMMTEWRNLDEPEKHQFLKKREDYELQFATLLRDAVSDGLLKITNIDVVLFAMLNTLNRFYAWYDKHNELNPIDLEHQLSEFFLSGLRP